MSNATTVLKNVREALEERNTERGERNAVVRVLAKYGHVAMPKVDTGREPSGATIRTYSWSTPWGQLVLVSGPSLLGEAQWAKKMPLSAAPKGAYTQLERMGKTAEKKIASEMDRIISRTKVSRADERPKRKVKAKAKAKVAAPKRKAKAPEGIGYRRAKEVREMSLIDARALLSGEPFRAPHHTTSRRGIIDEAMRAQGGILFLDEVEEFTPLVVEELRDALRAHPYVFIAYRTRPDTKATDRYLVRNLQILGVDPEAAEAEMKAAIGREQAGKNAEIAADNKAYSLVKMFKEGGNAGYLQDVMKMYHGNDEYESRAARSAINEFAQYAVPGVRIQEAHEIFAYAADGRLSDDKIVSYYTENRADIDQAPKWVAEAEMKAAISAKEAAYRKQIRKYLQGTGSHPASRGLSGNVTQRITHEEQDSLGMDRSQFAPKRKAAQADRAASIQGVQDRADMRAVAELTMQRGVWTKIKHDYYYRDPETGETLAPSIEDTRKSYGNNSMLRYEVEIDGSGERFEKLRDAKAAAIANAYPWREAPEPETTSKAEEVAEMAALLRKNMRGARAT